MAITEITPSYSVSPQITPGEVAGIQALGFRSILCNRPDGESADQTPVAEVRAEAERRGLRPLLALKSWAVAGVGPEVMGIGPVPSTAAALERAGLTLDEIDVIELNEAFAAQVLACLREWKIDPQDERLNPNGSGISLGHPLGATGARILATLAHELHRREGRYALETICIGGGQGIALALETLP